MNLFGSDIGRDAEINPYPCAPRLFSQLTGPIPTKIVKLSKLGKLRWFSSKFYLVNAET